MPYRMVKEQPAFQMVVFIHVANFSE